ncbi:hypothetical protein AAC387_Pa07g1228 [Persea americana]
MASGNSQSPFSNENGKIDDPTSPYYLHHPDNPGTVLVSQPLTGDNYPTWSRTMVMALTARNNADFIDGFHSIIDETDPLYPQWIRCNNMVLSWILISLSKEIAASVIYVDSAVEAWNDLKERFAQTNAPRVFQIEKAISSLIQEQTSVGASLLYKIIIGTSS